VELQYCRARRGPCKWFGTDGEEISELGDPLGASFRRTTQSNQSLPLIPYLHVDVGLWGAVDYGNRNGYRFIIGIVCRATGKLLLQPFRAKSEALAGFKRSIALAEAQRPGIQEHLRVWIKGAAAPSQGGTAHSAHERFKQDFLLGRVCASGRCALQASHRGECFGRRRGPG
jgi:hypothetical protein